MKKATKSKDRDKSRSEERRSYRHTRKRRKSESSHSDSDSHKKKNSDVHVDRKRYSESTRNVEKDSENVRSTRHSRRLAGTSDESKEEKTISLTLKIGKSDSKDNSPYKESKKKEAVVENSKPKVKEVDVWKVKSSNGRGAGELQKLKICRQRTPEPNEIMHTYSGMCPKKIIERNEPDDTVDTESIMYSSSRRESKESIDHSSSVDHDSDENKSSVSSSSSDGNSKAVVADQFNPENISDISLPLEPDPRIPSSFVQYNKTDDTSTLSPIIPEENVGITLDEIQLPVEGGYAPDKSPVSTENNNETNDIDSLKNCEETTIVNSMPQNLLTGEITVVKNIPQDSSMEETVDAAIVPQDDAKLPEEAIPPEKEISTVGEQQDLEKSVVPDKEIGSPLIEECAPLEPEKTNAIVSVEQKSDSPKEQNEKEKSMEKESASITDKVVNATVVGTNDEEYDYDENDDIDATKEEGELSGTEVLSPVHEVFKKLNSVERTHGWGVCNTFTFNRASQLSTEQILKAHKVEKLFSISKDILVDSDTDDLIFVKEIREDNVVHEVESDSKNVTVTLSIDGGNEERSDQYSSEEHEEEGNSDHNDNDHDDDDQGNDKKQEEPLSNKEKMKNNEMDDVQVKITFNNDSKKNREKTVTNVTASNKSSVDNSCRRRSSPHRKSSSWRDERHSKGNIVHLEQNVLYITNLVRPFTLTQLKELLQRTGKIAHDGFWIDSIKSKCYVQYETIDEAVETRHALHGIHWPVNNPKSLSVQFASQDDLLKAQTQTDISEIPRKTEPLVVENSRHRTDRIEWKRSEHFDDRPPKTIGVREWDIGKPKNPDEMVFADDHKLQKENIREKDSRKGEKGGTPTEGDPAAKKAKKSEVREGKMLDDLFKRTKTTPSVYWLPLTTEQIAQKEELRRKHLDVIKQRIIIKNQDNDSHNRSERSRRNSRRK